MNVGDRVIVQRGHYSITSVGSIGTIKHIYGATVQVNFTLKTGETSSQKQWDINIDDLELYRENKWVGGKKCHQKI